MTHLLSLHLLNPITSSCIPIPLWHRQCGTELLIWAARKVWIFWKELIFWGTNWSFLDRAKVAQTNCIVHGVLFSKTASTGAFLRLRNLVMLKSWVEPQDTDVTIALCPYCGCRLFVKPLYSGIQREEDIKVTVFYLVTEMREMCQVRCKGWALVTLLDTAWAGSFVPTIRLWLRKNVIKARSAAKKPTLPCFPLY